MHFSPALQHYQGTRSQVKPRKEQPFFQLVGSWLSPSDIGPMQLWWQRSVRHFLPKVWDERQEGKGEPISLAEMLTGTERFGTWMGTAASVDIWAAARK